MTTIEDSSEHLSRHLSRSGNISALVLAVLALAASGCLAVRFVALRAELMRETRALEQTKSLAAKAALDTFALPANRKLAVCNASGADATITAVAAFYTDREGVLRNFNSAANQWPVWTLAANSTRKIDFSSGGTEAWDGSVLFYAIDVTVEGGNRLLSGTSDDLKSGCIALSNLSNGNAGRSNGSRSN